MSCPDPALLFIGAIVLIAMVSPFTASSATRRRRRSPQRKERA